MGAIANGLAYHAGAPVYRHLLRVLGLRTPGDPHGVHQSPARHLRVHSRFHRRGRDGPTHQPIEQLMSLRLIPNLWVIRPADANEVVEAYQIAMKRSNGRSLSY